MKQLYYAHISYKTEYDILIVFKDKTWYETRLDWSGSRYGVVAGCSEKAGNLLTSWDITSVEQGLCPMELVGQTVINTVSDI